MNTTERNTKRESIMNHEITCQHPAKKRWLWIALFANVVASNSLSFGFSYLVLSIEFVILIKMKTSNMDTMTQVLILFIA
mmetsp:Transcript_27893/g.32001  ORF Transcript_27893/g.32001 Transcript_27893/m.32001 type:complete len:80 (-) Transcript_27893:564-803(-)